MPKVFAVCTGEYENYWPVALFSERAAAERFASECDGSIDEMTLDDPAIIAGIPRWFVCVDTNGNLTRQTEQSVYPNRDAADPIAPLISNAYWLTIAAPTAVEAETEARRLVMATASPSE